MENYERKINTKNMIVMGLIGMFIGIFISVFIMINATSSSQNSSSNLPIYATIGILTLLFGFWGSRMKPEEKKEEVLNQEGLTKKERILAWIFTLLNPVIAGAVMYYMWKNSYPAKAKQANRISFAALLIWLTIYILRKAM